MYCRNCGQKVADADLFCENCGTKIVRNTTPAEEKPMPSAGDTAPGQGYMAPGMDIRLPRQGLLHKKQDTKHRQKSTGPLILMRNRMSGQTAETMIIQNCLRKNCQV